jgi:phage FluMu protein Com
MMSWDDKLKIKEYCYNCSELTTLNNEKGIFHYELAHEAQEQDRTETMKAKRIWQSDKIIIVEGKWIDYKCPSCKKVVQFEKNEQTKKWVRRNKS